MSQENVERVREIYEGWAAGDFRVSVDDLDRNVVFVVGPDFPDSGAFHGTDGVTDWMRRFLEQWARVTIEAKHLQAVGDTVLAHIVQHSTGRASGIEGDLRYYMLFTFRGAKIIRIETIMHQGEALEAVGLSEQDAHADS
jgi:ketosteroid isomerase-like protein